MNVEVIGREEEIIILNRLLSSQEPELLAIYGRRRVGKTFLIKTHYKQHIIFSCSGQYNGKTNEQLINFTEQLNKFFPANSHLPINTWQEAFIQLQDAINSIKHKKKKVIFFDELPWLDSHKSGFLSSFSYFWNNYAAQRGDILVVICGSAASWIIDKVVNNKGGLHNRITQRIRLLPFTLKETEEYLKHKNIRYNHYQLLQLYMVMGGIPAYLNAIQRGKSVAWNIENACFTKDGILAGEFNNLYTALFNSPEKHVHIIQALAKKNKGLTRTEILKTSKLLTGGGTSTILSELTESGFIEKTYPFGKKEKDSLYRLTDEFSLFYFRFMHNQKGNKKGQWLSRQATQAYISWCGYAFENICFKHVTQIKQALQIGGIQSTGTSWLEAGKADKGGAQIDLLLDRADNIINLCEMKFSTKPFAVDKKYAAELQNKLHTFRGQTNTRKTVMLTFITVYGVADNAYKQQLVDNEITAQALFI